MRSALSLLIFSVMLSAVLAAWQPPGGRGRGGGFGGGGFGGGGMRQPQVVRSDYPMWSSPAGFERDVFTFVRVQYDSTGGRGGAFGGWSNDFPDCDLNFSFRLQQLTTLQVNPNALTMRLDDPHLMDYPFLFITNMGGISLSEAERKGMRTFLLRGGFMMADDFWAAAEWEHIRYTMRQVFPERQPRELTLEHEIFHTVYDFEKLPQVPSIRAWQRGLDYEDWHGEFTAGDTTPHFWGYFDDENRLMALFCHNNDIADGWEREGENIEYFERYSHKVSYPFGINIINYAMTH